MQMSVKKKEKKQRKQKITCTNLFNQKKKKMDHVSARYRYMSRNIYLIYLQTNIFHFFACFLCQKKTKEASPLVHQWVVCFLFSNQYFFNCNGSFFRNLKCFFSGGFNIKNYFFLLMFYAFFNIQLYTRT